MLKNINLNELINLSNDDVRELLVNENLNKQELRELIYRLINMSKEYKRTYEYEKEKTTNLLSRLERIKNISQL